MSKSLRGLLALSVATLGIISLLATSPPPPSTVSIISLNDFDGDVDFTPRSYACQDELVRVRWSVTGSGSGVLNAEPSDSFQPALSNKEVGNFGELELTALANSSLSILSNASDDYSRVSELRILEEAYCSSFGFVLVGLYEGELVQTSPSEETLPQVVRLRYLEDEYDAQAGKLYLSFGELAEQDTRTFLPSQTSAEGYPCTLNEAQKLLTCEAADESFTLSAEIVDEGLIGTYSGALSSTGALLPFSGRLSVTKVSANKPQGAL